MTLPASNQRVGATSLPPGTIIGGDRILPGDATPMTDEEMAQPRLRSVSVMVYEFDSADNAATAYLVLAEQTLQMLSWDVQVDGATITSEDLTGVGDQATLARRDMSSGSGSMLTEQVTFQRDQYVITVGTSWGSSMPSTEASAASGFVSPTTAIATDLATNGDASVDDVAFMETRTRTGGLWGFMPSEGDENLRGLLPAMDTVLYPITTP